MHALDVIAVVARLDGLEQIGILAIARTRGRHKLVGCLFVRAVLRKHDDRAIVSGLFQYVLDRHRICHTAVDILVTINLDRRRHQRQRGRGTHAIDIEHGVFDEQVGGGAK